MGPERQLAGLLLLWLLSACGTLTITLPGEEISPGKAGSASTARISEPMDLVKGVSLQILNPPLSDRAKGYQEDDGSLVMQIGATAEVAASVLLKDGTQSQNVSWSASDNTVLHVRAGRISAHQAGVSTVVATANLDARYKGLLHVRVLDAAHYAPPDRVKSDTGLSSAWAPRQNTPPVIQYVLAHPGYTIRSGDRVTLTAGAFDPDQDVLKYIWSATQGTLSASQGQQVHWWPGQSDGSTETGHALITLRVDDGQGGTASTAIQMAIEP